eukprot:CAMPEP_0180651582 /NCGR_PEP_ID=MMETSP1037_2-20121125/52973_1 /TAXON_ID=632150 /ORGANISM="Azadinium spinosum, Strain 3D9" /LENGTH=66 /DNA_ID=CAMNT_0022677263 /DNA_START=16 /DNA_END=212 /DNA_ORIENTATION=+
MASEHLRHSTVPLGWRSEASWPPAGAPLPLAIDFAVWPNVSNEQAAPLVDAVDAASAVAGGDLWVR